MDVRPPVFAQQLLDVHKCVPLRGMERRLLLSQSGLVSDAAHAEAAPTAVVLFFLQDAFKEPDVRRACLQRLQA